MRRRTLHSLAVVAAVGLALIAGLSLAPLRSDATDASWSDAEGAAATTATTTLQPPNLLTCTASGTNAVVTWNYPNSNVPGLTGSNVAFSMSGGLLPTGSYSTSAPTNGTYTTTISAGSVLTVGTFTITAQTNYNNWTAASPKSISGTAVVALGIVVSLSCNNPA